MNPTPLPPQTIQHWLATGLLHLPTCGTGHRQEWPAGEVRAAVAVDAVRHLGGTRPERGGISRESIRLRNDVAQAARANPPGTLVELPCPVPWIRMLLVVPE